MVLSDLHQLALTQRQTWDAAHGLWADGVRHLPLGANPNRGAPSRPRAASQRF
jgi:hypothetical protein